MTTSCKIIIKTNQMPPFIKERVERQRLIKAFIKGEISKEELKDKGVEIVSPLPPSDADWNSEADNHWDNY